MVLKCYQYILFWMLFYLILGQILMWNILFCKDYVNATFIAWKWWGLNYLLVIKIFLLLISSTSLYILTVVSKMKFLYKKGFTCTSVWLNERIVFISEYVCNKNNKLALLRFIQSKFVNSVLKLTNEFLSYSSIHKKVFPCGIHWLINVIIQLYYSFCFRKWFFCHKSLCQVITYFEFSYAE